MRPTAKVLKALVRHGAWEAKWFTDEHGKLQTELDFEDDASGMGVCMLVCPLGWLEWQYNQLRASLVTEKSCGTRKGGSCAAHETHEFYSLVEMIFRLDKGERRHWRTKKVQRALARILGIDPAQRAALQAAAPFRMSDTERVAMVMRTEQRRARKPQRERRCDMLIDWRARWPGHGLERCKRFAKAVDHARSTISLLNIEDGKAQEFFSATKAWGRATDTAMHRNDFKTYGKRHRRFTPARPDGALLN